MARFVALFASAVAFAGVLALAALGLLVLRKATGVVNFAHGELITLGAYLALWAIADLGLPVVPGYVLAVVLMFGVGVALERVAYAPLRKRPQLIVLIATLAAALIIRALISLWKGATPQPMPSPVHGVVRVFGANIAYQRILIVVVAGLVIGAMSFLFQRTSFGRQVRALAADPEAAELYGVRTRRVSVVCWGLSASLACLAGILIAPLTALDLTFGFALMITAFAACAFGGFSSLPGALVGALVIGFVQQVIGGYWWTSYASVLPFILLFVLIAVRPQGFTTTTSRL
jgi:branched-chain amino acid transport system permease protein